MMSMKQITEILKCNRVTAGRALKLAGITIKPVKFDHGRKHYYEVTEDQLPDILQNYQKDPNEIAMQQAASLSALEAAFGRLSGDKHA